MNQLYWRPYKFLQREKDFRGTTCLILSPRNVNWHYLSFRMWVHIYVFLLESSPYKSFFRDFFVYNSLDATVGIYKRHTYHELKYAHHLKGRFFIFFFQSAKDPRELYAKQDIILFL
jgi:hypothetical protein